jgi:hypothetical protein
VPGLGELLGDAAQRHVALPEHGAARLHHLDAGIALVQKNVAHGRFPGLGVDDLITFAQLIFVPQPVGGIHRKRRRRNADRGVDVREFELIDIAERIDEVARETERAGVGREIGGAQIVDLFVLAFELIEPGHVPRAAWRRRRLNGGLGRRRAEGGQTGQRHQFRHKRAPAVRN